MINKSRTLRSGKTLIGSWLSAGSPVVTEVAAMSGLSWLLVDLEHGAGTEAGLLQMLQGFRGTDCAAIVRPGVAHADIVLKALDWGADGLMFPHISSVEEAENCVQLASYAPRGKRGFSSSARVYDYGLSSAKEYLSEGTPFLIMQIETLDGVVNAAEIAGVEGVDALFVGPSDLSFDLSHRGPGTPTFEECLEKVAAASGKVGIPWGILARGKIAYQSMEPAPTFLAIDSDLGILKAHYQQLAKLGSP